MSTVNMPRGGTRRTVGAFTANVDMRFDEAVLADGTAAHIENFDVTSGALTDGYGVAEVSGWTDVECISLWQFRRYDYATSAYVSTDMYCSAGGDVYYRSGGTWTQLPGVKFTSPPRAVGYRLYGDDCIIMTSGTDGMYVWDGSSPAYKVDSPGITSMALSGERMFACVSGESNAVYFSDDLDPTEWTVSPSAGGFVQLIDERGRLLEALDFLGYVYLVREYGISRLSGTGDQSGFSVANLYVAGGALYAGGAAVCGDTIMLTGADGLYSFDGYSASRKLRAVRLAPSPDASAVYSDGKYYLAARTDSASEGNDTLIVYDLGENTFSLSRIAVTRLCKLGGDVYAVLPDGSTGRVEKCGSLLGVPLVKTWESGVMDYGTPKIKTVSEIALRTDKDVVLTVECGGRTRTFSVPGGGARRVRPAMSGETVKLKLTASAAGARISRLSVLVRSAGWT